MKPMSEAGDIEINNSPENPEVSNRTDESPKAELEKKVDSPLEEFKDSTENDDINLKEKDDSNRVEAECETVEEIKDLPQCENSTEASDGENRQNSVETVKDASSPEKNDRQASVEEKSPLPAWSYSQWSENYESLDDERPVEDLNGDPKKLILWAAEKNELETMRKLLEEDPSLVSVRDNDLYTPLHRASYSNNVEVIKMLLSYDADIHSQTSDGWQALHCACKWDSVEAVSLLLQNGADVNAQTKGHITPLHLAASNANGRRTLELLLWQPHIDPNIQNDAGDTAHDIAYRTGPLGALFEILEESVNVY